MDVLQKEDLGKVHVVLMVVSRSAKHYLPSLSTTGDALKKIVWLEMERLNW